MRQTFEGAENGFLLCFLPKYSKSDRSAGGAVGQGACLRRATLARRAVGPDDAPLQAGCGQRDEARDHG